MQGSFNHWCLWRSKSLATKRSHAVKFMPLGLQWSIIISPCKNHSPPDSLNFEKENPVYDKQPGKHMWMLFCLPFSAALIDNVTAQYEEGLLFYFPLTFFYFPLIFFLFPSHFFLFPPHWAQLFPKSIMQFKPLCLNETHV